MAQIFLSYARPNRDVAQRLAEALTAEGWVVFWDRHIDAGAEWNEEIQREIKASGCVLVLWSRDAKASFWVSGEAAFAHERGSYLPVRVDETLPPSLFGHVQAWSLQDWIQGRKTDELDRLLATIRSRIGTIPMYGNLEAVAADARVDETHLHLVHSCWRVDKETTLGVMPYQIHVILYGHPTALDRVEHVEYRLPGYPEGHDRQRGGSRERLFELKELANGFSIVQAEVHVRQPRGQGKRVLHLSRLVNMSESGPRLLEDFGRRSPFASSLESKLSSLPAATTTAATLLATMPPDTVKDRLVAMGTPLLMADAAVRQAQERLAQ